MSEGDNGQWSDMVTMDEGYIACGASVRFDQNEGITGLKLYGCTVT